MQEEIQKKKNEILEELDKLKHEFKFDLPQRINDARELGDLKENADYHAARERQGFVQARIAQLTEQLNKLNSINTAEIAEDRVGLGSTIEIGEQDSSFSMTLTFVIDAEADPGAGKLSLSTPYGRAFQGHMAGDVVEVNTPVGAKVFVLKKLTTIHGKTFEA